MPFLQVSNNARGNLVLPYTPGDATLTITAGTGALFPQSGTFHVTKWASIYETPYEDSNRQILEISSITGDVLTISDSTSEGTSDSASLLGARVALLLTAGVIKEIQD